MSELLRLIDLSDAAPLAQLQLRNRSYLKPWEPVRDDDYFTAAGQLERISSALARHERGEELPLVVLDSEGQLAGQVTMSGIVRGPFQSSNLGYWIAQDQEGRGLATLAVQEAVTRAFSDLDLHRVQAGTLTHNEASQRVLAKAGFQQFGLAPAYLKIAGEWQDHALFQKLRDDR